MAFVVIALIAAGGLLVGGFHQGQANPQADGFLDSKSKAFERL
ncbi:hypothetical protein U8C35_06415 [Sinorhizobium medicae]|nr:hypothetical protein [Sinorhizobium medicae]WQO60066.1 hypothetical protein U8C35_06415 [Sinorhizobium medicae]